VQLQSNLPKKKSRLTAVETMAQLFCTVVTGIPQQRNNQLQKLKANSAKRPIINTPFCQRRKKISLVAKLRDLLKFFFNSVPTLPAVSDQGTAHHITPVNLS